MASECRFRARHGTAPPLIGVLERRRSGPAGSDRNRRAPLPPGKNEEINSPGCERGHQKETEVLTERRLFFAGYSSAVHVLAPNVIQSEIGRVRQVQSEIQPRPIRAEPI